VVRRKGAEALKNPVRLRPLLAATHGRGVWEARTPAGLSAFPGQIPSDR
jgi:hypothetical protein